MFKTLIKLQKNLTFSILILFILLNNFISITSAHVLKAQDPVGAVLHISPEDDPIVGESSGFFFEFKDKEFRFTPENCDCVVVVIRSGEEVFRENLFANNSNPSLDNASVFYTFPEKGSYTIKVIGAPKQEGQFEPFTLQYDIQVTREKSSASPTTSTNLTQENTLTNFASNNFLIIGIGAFIAAAVLISLIIKKKS